MIIASLVVMLNHCINSDIMIIVHWILNYLMKYHPWLWIRDELRAGPSCRPAALSCCAAGQSMAGQQDRAGQMTSSCPIFRPFSATEILVCFLLKSIFPSLWVSFWKLFSPTPSDDYSNTVELHTKTRNLEFFQSF